MKLKNGTGRESLIQNSKILQNLKCFDYHWDYTNRKFHNWPHMTDQNPNRRILRASVSHYLLMIGIRCIWNLNEFHDEIWVLYLRYLISIYNISLVYFKGLWKIKLKDKFIVVQKFLKIMLTWGLQKVCGKWLLGKNFLMFCMKIPFWFPFPWFLKCPSIANIWKSEQKFQTLKYFCS